ncbi:3'-5' exonuclease [Trichuris suis]|nr:3'-5' exonuclease [Trichuris suis]
MCVGMSAEEEPTVSNPCEEATVDDISEGISNLKPTVSNPCDEQPVDEIIRGILNLKTISESDLDSMCSCIRRWPVRSFHKFSMRVHALPNPLFNILRLIESCPDELMDDILSRYPSLRNFAVTEISKMNDTYEVYRICQLFGIDGADVYGRLPYYGGNYAMSHGPLVLAQDLPAPTCLRLPPNVLIRFVRDAVGFKLAVEHAKRARLAALDTEWAPTIGFQSEDTIAALLQMAIGNIVYLVEIDELVRNSSAQDIVEAFESLFCSNAILKLGYDFSNQDVKALVSAVPFCMSVFCRTHNLVCIRNYTLSVINNVYGLNCPKKFSSLYNNQKGNCGLKNLCKIILDVDLDKRQRLSNWKRRPLRPEQVEYAALDVYCLLMIYQKLSTLTAST